MDLKRCVPLGVASDQNEHSLFGFGFRFSHQPRQFLERHRTPFQVENRFQPRWKRHSELHCAQAVLLLDVLLFTHRQHPRSDSPT